MAASIPATTARDDSPARVATLVGNHGPTLLRVARKVSLCADDAHDAFQRALEIYLRRLDTVDPATEVAWMRVVVRNEALAVRKSRSRLVSGEEVDFDAQVDSDQRSPEDRLESAQRVTRSAEALRHLKRDEAQALMLKAEGLSYGEIGEQLGWTYTKVNRCITEGRARFRRVFHGIESGEQCERFAPLLASLAVGEADSGDLVKLRPHLRHCGACRAEVRRLHGARSTPVAAFFPLPALVERLRPTNLKAELYGLLSRLSGTDPVSSSVMSGGGGRGMSATALIGVCLAGAGAGGYCVAGGPLPGSDAPKESRVQRQPVREGTVNTGAVSLRRPAAVASAPRVRTRAASQPSPSPRASAGSSRNQAEREFSIENPAPARTATPDAGGASAAALAPPAAPPVSENPAPASTGPEFGFEK